MESRGSGSALVEYVDISTKIASLLLLLLILQVLRAERAYGDEPAVIEELELQQSARIEVDERRSRWAVENELVKAGVVRHSNGERAELYPGLRSEHLSAGSLVGEGLISVAGSGNFVGYAASEKLGKMRMRVDFGMEPGKRRGLALQLDPLLLYWLSDADVAETGVAGSLRAGGNLSLDIALSRHRFRKARELELSAEELYRGRSEEMLRAACALGVHLPFLGRLQLLGAASSLPSYPYGYFAAASLAQEWRLLSYLLAGSYAAPFYLLRDGDFIEERRAASAGLELLPRAPFGVEGRYLIRDRGTGLEPDLYHASKHELGGKARLSILFLRLEGERELEWEWERDGEGAYTLTDSISLDFERKLIGGGAQVERSLEGESAGGERERLTFTGELEIEYEPFTCKVELQSAYREREEMAYSVYMRLRLRENGEVFGEWGRENDTVFWRIGWDVAAVLRD